MTCDVPRPADHPAEIVGMVSPPNWGTGEARTKFVCATTANGVASFGEFGKPSLLKRESSGTPEGVPEVQHTPARLAGRLLHRCSAVAASPT